MKIALISPFPDINCYGLRMISASLKKAGHDVSMYFLIQSLHCGNMARYPYKGYASVMLKVDETKSLLEQLAERIKSAGLIGISVISNFLDEVIQITRFLHEKSCGPVIWGGIHPTVAPEASLDHTDMICVGEGEDAVVELAKRLEYGESLQGLKNILFREEGKILKSECRPLVQDLDSLPTQDFDCDSHYVWAEDGFRQMTNESLKYFLKDPMFEERMYLTMPSRGCYNSCTYCCNNYFNKTVQGPENCKEEKRRKYNCRAQRGKRKVSLY